MIKIITCRISGDSVFCQLSVTDAVDSISM